VIDCYINLIKAQEHLKCQSGGRVHIENAFQFNFLKRDGDVETKTDELYPIKDMAQISSAERRVLLYPDHDMVNTSLQSTRLVFTCIFFAIFIIEM
jgi:sentrin-specific protease 1